MASLTKMDKKKEKIADSLKTTIVVPQQTKVVIKAEQEEQVETASKKKTRRLRRAMLDIPKRLQNVISLSSKKTPSEILHLRTIQAHNVAIRYPVLAAAAPTVNIWADEWKDFLEIPATIRLDHFLATLTPCVEVTAFDSDKSTLVRLADFESATKFIEGHLATTNLKSSDASSSDEDEEESLE